MTMLAKPAKPSRRLELHRDLVANDVGVDMGAVGKDLMNHGCPCCGGDRFRHLLRFVDVPVSGRFRTPDAARPPRIDLAFEACEDCGLLRQAPFVRTHLYEEIDRSTTLQKPAHLTDIVTQLAMRGVGRDELILEIGSNDGAFLDALRLSGFSNLVGVEPSRTLSGIAAAKGHRIESKYFGPEMVARMRNRYGAVRVVVCRHTLEHVPDLSGFCRAIRDCMDSADGIVFVEVPDGSAVLDQLNVYELWDEHLYVFTANNLRQLIARAGLEVESIDPVPHMGTWNLVAWARIAGHKPAAAIRSEAPVGVARWKAFAQRVQDYRVAFLAALASAPRPVYFIGASHPQSNLANYLDAGAYVDFMIDDDPAKVGRLAPVRGEGARIISTTVFLATVRWGTVVRSGFGYPDWMNRICGHASSCGMTVIDPLLYRPQ